MLKRPIWNAVETTLFYTAGHLCPVPATAIGQKNWPLEVAMYWQVYVKIQLFGDVSAAVSVKWSRLARDVTK